MSTHPSTTVPPGPDTSELEQHVAGYRQALADQPDSPDLWNHLGRLLRILGRLDEAAAAYLQAITLSPRDASFRNELGLVFMDQGRLEDAVLCYQQSLYIDPDFAEAHNNLGIARASQGSLAEAVALYRQALALQADYPEAVNNLGNALSQQQKWADAAAVYRQALALRPDYPEAHYNLGLALASQGRPDEAIACYQRAVQLKPDYTAALNNLANTYKDQGWLDEAIASYRQALVAAPDDLPIGSNLLYALQYHPGFTAETVFAEHRDWARRFAEVPALWQPSGTSNPDPSRRLRIGYVSPDYREHVMGRYSEAVIRTHDRRQVEVFCYADVPQPDALTQQTQAAADQWRSLVGLSDAQAADLVRRDDIDILIDLAGHTGGNRLGLFARRPAPIQATHFGYPATTGLTAIDYRLSDPYADPPGKTERYHTEQLVRLPEVLWCYPPPPSPDVRPLPALQTGHVTFGSFNNLCKVTDEAIFLWARILRAVPGSRMVLLTGAGAGGDERLLAEFGRHGIGRERLTLLSRRSREAYFAAYHEVDLCLDTFPYTGCNTTADALWMGVPVVTLAGPSCTSRQGIAALVHVGLRRLVTTTPAAYVRTAIQWARELHQLRECRAGLRERMQRSPLTDVPRFTRHLEEAYRDMWQRWCSRPTARRDTERVGKRRQRPAGRGRKRSTAGRLAVAN